VSGMYVCIINNVHCLDSGVHFTVDPCPGFTARVGENVMLSFSCKEFFIAVQFHARLVTIAILLIT
jgi:hypothetical protein